MTSYQELDNAFKLHLDKGDSQGMPEFLPREREQFLNEAQQLLVTQLLAPRVMTQDVADQLKTLLVHGLSLPATQPEGEPTYRLELPANYRRFARLGLQVQSNFTSNYLSVPAKMVSQDELGKISRDPFNKSSIQEPVAFVAQDAIYVQSADSFRVNTGSLSYYRSAKKLSYADKVGTELPEELVAPLIDLAVFRAKRSIQSPDASFQAQTLTTS